MWRTDEQQVIYVEQGKSQVSMSQHQKRLAVDLNLFVNGKIQWEKNSYWEDLGNYWKSLDEDNRWGGDYKTLHDPFHFERIS